MNEYLARYPDVSLELRTGNTRQLAAEVLGGELDAALTSDPVADAPFEKVPIYEEELVIIATAGHPPIKSPRDAASGSRIGSPITGKCPSASSKLPPTTPCSDARLPAWAFH
jgi:DNA-binding transcriptional LysR family regulator